MMIAMALACDPDVIVADEPTTALDVIVQAQVLHLLSDLVRDRGLTLVMIGHDLAVLAAVCDRIVVMRHGKIVEEGPARQVLDRPRHAHTRDLAAAFPVIGDPSSRLRVGRIRDERAAGSAAGRPTDACSRSTSWWSTSPPAEHEYGRWTMSRWAAPRARSWRW